MLLFVVFNVLCVERLPVSFFMCVYTWCHWSTVYRLNINTFLCIDGCCFGVVLVKKSTSIELCVLFLLLPPEGREAY